MSGGAGPAKADPRRGWITLSVMLATTMPLIDMTIANVALPHMQGSMSATQEQISWVLTSYIVATAIALPLTGFVSARFGRKKVFVISVVGFTAASMLCGAAQSLEQIVVFRLLQGISGAALVPLSQVILLDAYPVEKHSWAMALWGIGVMVGPIIGPTLGGFLTEYYSWRWVFYINLPFGVLACLGLAAFVRETAVDRERQFDLLGFALLGLALGALQMMLDRGESHDWFSSREIVIEAVLALVCFYLFVAHIFTCRNPFLDPALFRDRNFALGLLAVFIVGANSIATMVLLPPFLQSLVGYPVLDVGWLMAPRGLGTMAGMLLVGKLTPRVGLRERIVFGLVLTGISLWDMTGFTAEVRPWDIVRTGVVQGLGLGSLFPPLTAMTFSTLAPRYRNEGTSLYNLLRNLGSSIGVSIIVTAFARNAQANHAAFATYLTPFSVPLQEAVSDGAFRLDTGAGLAALDAEVARQAATLAYLQDFRLMMWVTLLAIPLALLLKGGVARPPAPAVAQQVRNGAPRSPGDV